METALNSLLIFKKMVKEAQVLSFGFANAWLSQDPRKETRLAMMVTCYLFKNKCKWLKGNISELIQVIVSSYEKGK